MDAASQPPGRRAETASDERVDHRHGRRVVESRPAVERHHAEAAERRLPRDPGEPERDQVSASAPIASLADVPEPIDIVDVFRRAEYTPAIADEAVKVGAKALWLQSGVVNDEAAAKAEAGGLMVVMDACIGVMHSVLRVPNETSGEPARPTTKSLSPACVTSVSS